MKGIVFDIQRFSVHDGRGIRTNIFLKGCPLHCDWCCNPESQSPYPQPLYEEEKCIGCGACIEACKNGAISREPVYHIDAVKCRACTSWDCARECYARALSLAGTAYTPQEILEIIQKDQAFYRSSQGGMTLSGGEAVMQIDFAEELLRLCREQGIDTAMETCSACPWESIRRTLPYVNTYLCDVKHTDPAKLKAETGGDAERILGNIRRLAEHGANIIARIPVIPGFNSQPEEIAAIGRYLTEVGIRKVNLLKYHRMGEPKYKKIFCGRRPKKREELTDEQMQELLKILTDMGLEASVG